MWKVQRTETITAQHDNVGKGAKEETKGHQYGRLSIWIYVWEVHPKYNLQHGTITKEA